MISDLKSVCWNEGPIPSRNPLVEQLEVAKKRCLERYGGYSDPDPLGVLWLLYVAICCYGQDLFPLKNSWPNGSYGGMAAWRHVLAPGILQLPQSDPRNRRSGIGVEAVEEQGRWVEIYVWGLEAGSKFDTKLDTLIWHDLARPRRSLENTGRIDA